MTEVEAKSKAAWAALLAMAEELETHGGGDETNPWQQGHNYAVAEMCRLIRERAEQFEPPTHPQRPVQAVILAELRRLEEGWVESYVAAAIFGALCAEGWIS